MSKHTPGPWRVGEEKDAIWISPPNSSDNVICDMVGRAYGVKNATVTFTDEDAANARLIAAAPEMLAELEKIANDCEICGGFGIVEYQPSGLDGWLPTGDANFVTEDCPHCSGACAIIAKAKGEQ